MNIIDEVFDHTIVNGNRNAFTSPAGRLSYEDLWRRSDNLAGWLSLQTTDTTPVIVYGHNDPMMLVCFQACSKCGRPYCPIDISVPEERVASIAELIGDPLILIAHGEETPDLNGYGRVVCYDILCNIADLGVQNKAYRRCRGEDIFYIIFTSGSTGVPKGVQVTASNLNSFLEWALTLAGGIRPGSVFLNQAPYSFDLSVMDLYLSLATGGTIVSVDKEMQQNVNSMIGYLRDNDIEYWISTPSFAELCLSDPDFVWMNLSKIKAFIFCGEVLATETARRLMERFPGVRIVNTYGPTEATVCVTEVEITDEHISNEHMLPVGKSASGTWITVDPDTSEVIITGPTVSAGYYKDPERTSRAFSATRFAGTASYRTGDKGHFDESGMLFIDGRMDNQIKLHGYRIEIEDIEANIEMLEGVKKAVVLPHYRDGRVDSLTAYIMKHDGEINEDYSGRKRIRRELGRRLPAYMIPKRIRFIDEMPMNANGKLDRKRLMENTN